jgi:uncharacterized SAM-binding protein YcdF (DUF218 family)
MPPVRVACHRPARRGSSGTIATRRHALPPPVNHLFVLLGLESWKPALTALLLPPVPFLLLVLIGTRVVLSRRSLGWFIVSLGVAGTWLSMCTGVGRAAEQVLLDVPHALSPDRIRQIKADPQARSADAIVVLGGGMEPLAPEYGISNLGRMSLERLRYGLWLSRETGVPVAFSGGIGWASQNQGSAEADVASRIATQDFNRPLKWVEDQSRDTRENAARTMPLLKRAGVTHIVLVTHGWHMPRSMRAFEEAGRANGITVEPAPMGLAIPGEVPVLNWVPTDTGYMRVRNALREWLGLLLGA